MNVRAECRWLLRVSTTFMVFTMMFTAFSVFCLGDSSVSSQVLTPIQNFEPSWTASSVGGNTIAIPFTLTVSGSAFVKQNLDTSSDAVVVLFRTTSPLALSSNIFDAINNQKTKQQLKSSVTLGGLKIVGPIYTTLDVITWSQSSQRWTFLGSTALCSMTGFSPDIDYLTRFLQNIVDNHRKTYESTSIFKTNPISLLKLVESFADELQEAGQWQGGRPFGVQALIVGRDSVIGKASSLGIFTLDPSGGYRRWRGGTAIGRNGKNIRDRLFDFWMTLNDTNGLNDDGAEALRSALQVSVLSRIEESENSERSDMYEAILIWQADNEFCVGHIDTALINEMRESILTKHKVK